MAAIVLALPLFIDQARKNRARILQRHRCSGAHSLTSLRYAVPRTSRLLCRARDGGGGGRHVMSGCLTDPPWKKIAPAVDTT